MDSQNISPLNFSNPQIGFIGEETLDKLSGINSAKNFSGNSSDRPVNAEIEAIGVTPLANHLGGKSLIFDDQSLVTSKNTQPASDGTDPLIGNGGVSTEVILSKAIARATTELADFISQPKSIDQMHLSFGDSWEAAEAIGLVQNLATGEALPKIEIIPMTQLGTNGAFAKETNTIYLAAEFLNKNAANLETITAVVLEEAGHFLDSKLNAKDSPGDEGEIFAALVQGKEIAPLKLLALKAEDDSGTLTINGQTIQVEHSPDSDGVFIVGETGEVTIDFLADSGSYAGGEVAIFSLQGMDGLARGSVAFTQEAARRALSNSELGYVAISDATEGGRFTGELGESNKNAGAYSKMKTFVMNPDEEFAIMLVSNGTVKEVFNNPAIDGNKHPLFSIAAANPNNAMQMGQLVQGSVDEAVFGFEDIRLDQQSDQDYNDIIFKIGGVAGSAKSLGELIVSAKDWQNTDLGQKLRNFAAEELSTATDWGTVTGSKTLNDFVGNDDPTDVYSFTLDTASNVNITLSGLSGDADLVLIEDANGNGVLDEYPESSEIIELSDLEGTASEKIDLLLQAGTYLIQVEQYESDTNYDLSLNITPFMPPTDTAPNTIPTARDLGVISGTLPAISEYVGNADTIDYFKFNITTQSDLDLELSNLSGDADVRLICDTNNNGVVDDGDVKDFSDSIGNDNEYIFAPDLAAGNYFIEVQHANGETTYDLLLNATASTTPVDNAGNSLGEAKDLGTLSSTVTTITDSVNNRDQKDFYKFTVAQNSTLNLSLSGMSGDADVQLIRDADNNKQIDDGDIIAASTHATGNEIITIDLEAGTYTAEVSAFQGSTPYSLGVSATPTTQPPTPITQPAGATLETASAQASPTFTASGNVTDTTQENFYKFTVNESGIFTANLTDLTGNADVRLIRDYNNNHSIDEVQDRNGNVYLDKEEVEIVAWQPNRDASNESIRAFLESGDYFLEVNSPKKATTNYKVSTTFTPAATDPLAFKINVNFTDAAKLALSPTLQKIVTEAGNYWSRVITHSTFPEQHIIEMKVEAKVDKPGTLASAAPEGPYPKDKNGHPMAKKGYSEINVFPSVLKDYEDHPRFLYDTMIHEFGHVIGFWGDSPKYLTDKAKTPFLHSWNNRNLVDLDLVNLDAPKNEAPLYNGIFASTAYGELLGTNQPTPLPLTIDGGEGSNYSHWSKKVFFEEAQTESGSKDVLAPFAVISIASARDLGFNVNYGAGEPYKLSKPQA